jgi:hypothetical protein
MFFKNAIYWRSNKPLLTHIKMADAKWAPKPFCSARVWKWHQADISSRQLMSAFRVMSRHGSPPALLKRSSHLKIYSSCAEASGNDA